MLVEMWYCPLKKKQIAFCFTEKLTYCEFFDHKTGCNHAIKKEKE